MISQMIAPGPAVHPTAGRQLDEAVARLRDAAPAFARLPLTDRIALARSMQAGYLRIAEQSVRAACAAKGIPLGTPAESEEWATGPWCVVRHLRLIAESLAALQRTGALQPRVVQPSPALIAAQADVSQLIIKWDDALANRIAADNLLTSLDLVPLRERRCVP